MGQAAGHSRLPHLRDSVETWTLSDEEVHWPSQSHTPLLGKSSVEHLSCCCWLPRLPALHAAMLAVPPLRCRVGRWRRAANRYIAISDMIFRDARA